MTKCILIFKEIEKCIYLLKDFEDKSIYLSQALLISPSEEKLTKQQKEILLDNKSIYFKVEQIENNRILNPKLDRKIRQSKMKNWLMPFGFLAGLAFSNMTNLTTFSFIGLNSLGESIFGGILGMISGYLGSFFASASINFNRDKELRPLLNANKEGKWLMLLENQDGYELPWNLLRDSEPIDLVFLQN